MMELPHHVFAKWERELRQAGWKRVDKSGIFLAPCGCRYRGPYYAWGIMRDRALSGAPCTNDHSKESPVRG